MDEVYDVSQAPPPVATRLVVKRYSQTCTLQGELIHKRSKLSGSAKTPESPPPRLEAHLLQTTDVRNTAIHFAAPSAKSVTTGTHEGVNGK